MQSELRQLFELFRINTGRVHNDELGNLIETIISEIEETQEEIDDIKRYLDEN